MRKTLLTVIAMLTLVGGLMVAPTMAQAPGGAGRMAAQREGHERHPAIRHAIEALRAAKDDLEDASHDFCGHREDALESTNNALRQLQMALESDRAGLDPVDAAQAGLLYEKASWNGQVEKGERGERNERHPKIRQAIRALERAKGDLQNGAHDFKGHREEALDATNNAITRLRAALACDRK